MRTRGVGTARDILAAAAIALGCLTLAWLAIRTTAVAVVPATQPVLAAIAPGDPNRILDAETIRFALGGGKVPAGDAPAIAAAARAAPLDARPYMFAASNRLNRKGERSVIPLLEAGRRLDPQNRWIRFYLLDRYLRAGRYAEAATELSVIDRLVGDVNNPVVAALVQMSLDPAMSPAVRQMFARDAKLEGEVLAKLAASGTPPQQIFAIASPAARAAAGKPGGWGTVLVATLVGSHDYARALAVWRSIYAIKPSADAPLLYDGAFKGLPGSPPFNWTLVANEIGAADTAGDGVTVSYYGRQPGELADQLMLLPPGQYRLVFALSGPPPSNGGPTLSWNVACDQHESPLVLDGAVPGATEKGQTIAMQFTVPAQSCRAQWLRLMGNPGQYPGTMTATIERVAVQPLQAKP